MVALYIFSALIFSINVNVVCNRGRRKAMLQCKLDTNDDTDVMRHEHLPNSWSRPSCSSSHNEDNEAAF